MEPSREASDFRILVFEMPGPIRLNHGNTLGYSESFSQMEESSGASLTARGGVPTDRLIPLENNSVQEVEIRSSHLKLDG